MVAHSPIRVPKERGEEDVVIVAAVALLVDGQQDSQRPLRLHAHDGLHQARLHTAQAHDNLLKVALNG